MAIADQVDDDREAAFSHVKEIELARNEAIEEADRVLAEIVRADRRATAGELSYFAQSLHWDERQVKNELRRMSSVLRLRGIAGSVADRAAASVEADTAAAVVAKEGPRLQAKIDELTAKLRSLDADARLSAKRQSDQAEAVEQLRTLAPQHIRDGVRHRQSELDHGTGKLLADAEIRHNEIECCLDPSKYRNEQAYLEVLQRSCRDAVETFATGGYRKLKLSTTWPGIRLEMEAERERLAGDIAKLKATIAAQEAEIRKALDYYAAGD